MTRSKKNGNKGIGNSLIRPDGKEKVMGSFEYSSDLYHEDMLWGATLRSPHPSAKIVNIDTSEAEIVDGVVAVLTSKDLPGKPDLVFPLKLFLVRFPNAILFSVKESLVGRLEAPDFDLFYHHGTAEGIAMKTFG